MEEIRDWSPSTTNSGPSISRPTDCTACPTSWKRLQDWVLLCLQASITCGISETALKKKIAKAGSISKKNIEQSNDRK